ncbi:Hypothetical predicted protein [Octopus vulgaris]|uniref:Uncharacterized protein n=1 Tax=Octopus vulgaris TaxID=6645 RepID=A0AA36B454_OCTVU|nr:Hypothetical predicted protein [Octopus vulgaris]
MVDIVKEQMSKTMVISMRVQKEVKVDYEKLEQVKSSSRKCDLTASEKSVITSELSKALEQHNQVPEVSFPVPNTLLNLEKSGGDCVIKLQYEVRVGGKSTREINLKLNMASEEEAL